MASRLTPFRRGPGDGAAKAVSAVRSDQRAGTRPFRASSRKHPQAPAAQRTPCGWSSGRRTWP